MLRRTLLTTAVISIAVAISPAIPAAASTDPAAFINNLGNQLVAVTRYTTPQQKLAGARELFHEISMYPASVVLFLADIGGF